MDFLPVGQEAPSQMGESVPGKKGQVHPFRGRGSSHTTPGEAASVASVSPLTLAEYLDFWPSSWVYCGGCEAEQDATFRCSSKKTE